MSDVHSQKVRSYNMSRIKGKDTKPEMLVRKFLFSKGYRYRLHVENLAGKPDIFLPKYNTIIFVNGCFWHGHKGCKYFILPKTRADWWEEKINRNIARDKVNIDKIKEIGFNIIIIYECDLRSDKIENTLKETLKEIENGR
jgi:DNA mismatch endonuclease (patch repair protein)